MTFTVTATDDTDPDPAVFCEPASGTQFPIGTTVVSAATDSSGNSTAGQFVVTSPPVR